MMNECLLNVGVLSLCVCIVVYGSNGLVNVLLFVDPMVLLM